MTTTVTTESDREITSFREKTAWACFLITLLVWVPYFAHVLQLFRHNELTAGRVLGMFIGAVVVQVAIQIVAAVAIAIHSKEEPKDERDLAIEARAAKNAYFVLCSLVFMAGWIVWSVAAVGEEAAGLAITPLLISQLVLFCFILGETVRFGTQVVSYRRGR